MRNHDANYTIPRTTRSRHGHPYCTRFISQAPVGNTSRNSGPRCRISSTYPPGNVRSRGRTMRPSKCQRWSSTSRRRDTLRSWCVHAPSGESMTLPASSSESIGDATCATPSVTVRSFTAECSDIRRTIPSLLGSINKLRGLLMPGVVDLVHGHRRIDHGPTSGPRGGSR